MFLLRKLKALCKKVHNNYQKHFFQKNWSSNKEVITMGVFVADITSLLMDKNHIQIHPWYNLYICHQLWLCPSLLCRLHKLGSSENVRNHSGISESIREFPEIIQEFSEVFGNFPKYSGISVTIREFPFPSNNAFGSGLISSSFYS